MIVLAAAIYVAILPSYCFVNRGFTQWFHHVAIFYAIITSIYTGGGQQWQWQQQQQFLEQFQILSGFSICIGWYSSIVYEYITYDRFCQPLYQNMPSILTQYMVIQHDDSNNNSTSTTTLDFNSTTALSVMGVSHLLDILAHPVLTYYFWKRHVRRGGTMYDVITSWQVIVSAYAFSRSWSLFHTYYNFGYENMSLWYVGHDVYIMNELDSWYPAYIAEGIVFGSATLYKLLSLSRRKNGKDVNRSSSSSSSSFFETAKPSLIYSESSVSTESESMR
jgi:hypothetical protein